MSDHREPRQHPRDEPTVADRFRALANADRLLILEHLTQSGARPGFGLSTTDIASATGLSRFAAARHLETLAAAELVAAWRDGTTRRFAPAREGILAVEDWLLDLVDRAPQPTP